MIRVKVSEVVTFLLLSDYVLLGVDRHAEVDQGEHSDVHQYALDKQRSLVMVSKPEDYPQSVSHEESQANILRESLSCLFGFNL